MLARAIIFMTAERFALDGCRARSSASETFLRVALGKRLLSFFSANSCSSAGLRSTCSRGYGRRARGVLLVDPNGSAKNFGDEPLLIARRLGCPVVVGESRYEAGVFAENKFGPQLHILDDGFQHRSLARDFDIVLLTPEDLGDNILPTGRLREPLASMSRADAIVISGNIDTSDLPAGKPIWRIRRGTTVADAPKTPVVFCGIARPCRFVEQLKQIGIRPGTQKFYRDHHSYSDADIAELIRLRDHNKSGGFVTTEKDAVNLDSRIERLGTVVVAQVTMEFVEPADPLDAILRSITDRKGGHEKISG